MKVELLVKKPSIANKIVEGNRYLRILCNSFYKENSKNKRDMLKRDILAVESLIRELRNSVLVEDRYSKQIEQFLIDLFIAIKEYGLSSIPLSKIKNITSTQGYSISDKALYDIIKDIPNVDEVRPSEDTVLLSKIEIGRVVGDEKAQKERDQITKTATKVAKDRLK